MKQYDEKILTSNDLYNYESFLFLEGQTGLPDEVEEVFEMVSRRGIDHWVLEDIFQKPERIKAIPFLNPSVIVFQTTMMSRDKINDIIEYLEGQKWKPREIWQLINHDIPIVDSSEYDVFTFWPEKEKGTITLIKL